MTLGQNPFRLRDAMQKQKDSSRIRPYGQSIPVAASPLAELSRNMKDSLRVPIKGEKT